MPRCQPISSKDGRHENSHWLTCSKYRFFQQFQQQQSLFFNYTNSTLSFQHVVSSCMERAKTWRYLRSCAVKLDKGRQLILVHYKKNYTFQEKVWTRPGRFQLVQVLTRKVKVLTNVRTRFWRCKLFLFLHHLSETRSHVRKSTIKYRCLLLACHHHVTTRAHYQLYASLR